MPVFQIHNLQKSSFRFDLSTLKKTVFVLFNFALFVFQVAYSRRDDVYKFVRKVLALPFLPSEHISPAFDGIRAKAQGEQVTSLLNYVEDNWLLSTVLEHVRPDRTDK